MLKIFKAQESTKKLANIEGLINQKHIELEKVRSTFDLEVKKLEHSFVERKETLLQEILPLQSELKSLEARKEEALKPLDSYKLSLDERETALTVREDKQKDKEEEVRALERDLYTRLDGVEDLSSHLHEEDKSLKDKAKDLDNREKKVKKHEQECTLRILAVTEKESAFDLRVAKFEREKASKEADIQAEREFNQKEKERIASDYKQLTARRSALDQAIEVWKKKGVEIQ